MHAHAYMCIGTEPRFGIWGATLLLATHSSSGLRLCYLTTNKFYLFICVFFMCVLLLGKDKIISLKIF